MIENGYYFGFPHREEAYPNSQEESHLVLERMQEPDIEYFNLTDKSPKEPFLQYLESLNLNHKEELRNIINNSYPIIMEHKRYYNRPRPAQVNANIKPVKSLTANTPAYPAGHTFQAYLMAYYLSNKYPKHRKEFFRIAKRIADARVSVGLHYPSDNEAGIALAKKYEEIEALTKPKGGFR